MFAFVEFGKFIRKLSGQLQKKELAESSHRDVREIDAPTEHRHISDLKT